MRAFWGWPIRSANQPRGRLLILLIGRLEQELKMVDTFVVLLKNSLQWNKGFSTRVQLWISMMGKGLEVLRLADYAGFWL